jgi:hypothetical protein
LRTRFLPPVSICTGTAALTVGVAIAIVLLFDVAAPVALPAVPAFTRERGGGGKQGHGEGKNAEISDEAKSGVDGLCHGSVFSF